MTNKLLEKIGTMMPYTKSLENNMRFAGYEKIKPIRFAGIIASSSIVVSLISALLAYTIFGIGILYSIVVFALMIIIVNTIANLMVVFKADSRGKYVEKILPDALELISSNIRSGMTIDRAIWLSARPEFGPLQIEIKKVSAQMAGSASLPDALEKIRSNIKSKSLNRAIELINQGLYGGGEMAVLLDNVADDIRNFQTIVEENRATTTTYTIFIVMAAVIGAPILFAVSSTFIEIMSSVFQSSVVPDATGSFAVPGGFSGELQITPQMVSIFSMISITVIAFFASLLSGLIRTGEEKNGLKYTLIMIGVGLGIFFLTRIFVSGIFTSIAPSGF